MFLSLPCAEVSLRLVHSFSNWRLQSLWARPCSRFLQCEDVCVVTSHFQGSAHSGRRPSWFRFLASVTLATFSFLSFPTGFLYIEGFFSFPPLTVKLYSITAPGQETPCDLPSDLEEGLQGHQSLTPAPFSHKRHGFF